MKSFLKRAVFSIMPIYKKEIEKFLLLSGLFSLSFIVFTIVGNMKEILIFGSSKNAVATISNIKLYVTFPFSILILYIFNCLSNKWKMKNMFTFFALFFMTFFLIFGFIIFPNSDKLNFSVETMNDFYSSIPYYFFKNKLEILKLWTYVLFYVISDGWGIFIISIFFWELANRIVDNNQARRFYGALVFVGNLGLISAGIIIKLFWGVSKNLITNIELQTSFVALIIVFIIIIYLHLENKSLSHEKKSIQIIGFKRNTGCILKSKLALLILFIVVIQGITLFASETLWKNKSLEYYGTRENFNCFLAKFSVLKGISIMIISLIGSKVLQKFTWKNAAIICPVYSLISNFIFFILFLLQSSISEHLLFLVNFGFIQNIVYAGIKHSLFDTTKQIIYSKLSIKIRRKTQAAVTLVGGSLGEIGGPIIFELLSHFNNYNSKLFLLVLFIIITLLHLIWVSLLSKIEKVN